MKIMPEQPTERTEELKPCPFCGASLASYLTHRLSELWWSHPKNGCVLDDLRVSETAKTSWNTRSLTPQAGEQGWAHLNPDTGMEWSYNHPVESGECQDAEDIEQMTLAEFYRRFPADSQAGEGVELDLAIVRRLVNAAQGLSHGTDWNNGTHAKKHGYRAQLLDALPAAWEALERLESAALPPAGRVEEVVRAYVAGASDALDGHLNGVVIPKAAHEYAARTALNGSSQ